jgi:hypothetical protein
VECGKEGRIKASSMSVATCAKKRRKSAAPSEMSAEGQRQQSESKSLALFEFHKPNHGWTG